MVTIVTYHYLLIADWAGSHCDRRSATGYLTLVGDNLVTDKAPNRLYGRSGVARSSAEPLGV